MFRSRRRAALERTYYPRLESLEDRLAPATFMVLNTNDSGADSLRQAILDANSPVFPGADTIAFNILGAGVPTIALLSALPDVTDSVTIDGYTQPGASANTLAVGNDAVLLIEVSGAGAGPGIDGLRLNAANSIVQGLVINGFSGAGIVISGSGATGNVVQGNFIGTDAAGMAALPNDGSGVVITASATNNIVGGTTAGARNLISGNVGSGVELLSDTSGISTGNLVQGNYIGTDISGTVALGNNSFGVYIHEGARGNTIGGTAAGAGNVISGNFNSGMSIFADSAAGNHVQGNRIGTNAAGTAALPNAGAGVRVGGSAPNNALGGTAAGAGNLISGNFDSAVILTEDVTGTLVQGNFLGTNAAGTTAIANDRGLLIVSGAHDNTIGGTTAAARNVISGNTSFGVLITEANTTGNLLQGNYIGTNAAGTAAVPNEGEGILIANDANGNTVGGTAAGAGNVISGNSSPGGANGLSLASNGNLVEGNRIGTNAAGTAALGNFGYGVDVRTGAQNNTIRGNRIAFNGEGGVRVRGDDTTFGNAILDNRVSGNTGLGINVVGGTEDANAVTANDAGDLDAGPNSLQNFPVLTIASNTGTGTNVTGTLNSTANATFTLQFFANPTVDPSGFGEGEAFLGSTTVTTDGSGDASFTAALATPVPTEQLITATATDAANNTSEFSAGVSVGTTISISDQTITEGDANTVNADFIVSLSVASSQAVTVDVATASGTATSSDDFTALPTTTLTFDPGQTTQTITVQVQGDAVDEIDETFFVNLSGPSNAVLGDNQGQGTIRDDDGPVISIGGVILTEGDAGTMDAVFTVNLSATSPQPVTVDFTTEDRLATSPGDYETRAGTLTFDPGETSKSIVVPVQGDTLDEADEAFFVNLSSAANAVVAIAQGQGTIVDDDGPTVAIDDVAVTEGAGGVVSAIFTVSLSAASPQSVTVDFTTADGTATTPSDYQASAGTLTFNPGDTRATITFSVMGDTQVESDETFFVNLMNPRNATLADDQGLGTIQNDDTRSTVQFVAAAFFVAESAMFADITLTRDGGTADGASVHLATGSGTASAGPDYEPLAVTVSFASGEATKTVSVPIHDDEIVEGSETVDLTLSQPTGAVLGTVSTAMLTILDNDVLDTQKPSFVQQLYLDLLFRESEPEGLAYWNDQLAGGSSRAEVVLGIESSVEYRTLLIHDLYNTLLGRQPDRIGLSFFLELLAAGGSTEKARAALLGSLEYFQTRAAGSDAGFLTALYDDVLGRAADAVGFAFFAEALANGASRAQVADLMFASTEFQQDLVQDLYQRLLLRDADADGIDYFVAALQRGVTEEELIAALAGSGEYTGVAGTPDDFPPGFTATANQRFVTRLYDELLGRPVDATALAVLSGLLDRGVSRSQVVAGLSNTPEYRTQVVQQLYRAYLGREADPAGLVLSVQALAAGDTTEHLAAILLGSPEYFQGRGGGRELGFLEALVSDVLARPLDSAGASIYAAALTAGLARTALAAEVVNSSEARQVRIQGYYQRFLRRAADADGLNFALGLLQQGLRNEQVIAGLLSSDEFFEMRIVG